MSAFCSGVRVVASMFYSDVGVVVGLRLDVLRAGTAHVVSSRYELFCVLRAGTAHVVPSRYWLFCVLRAGTSLFVSMRHGIV